MKKILSVVGARPNFMKVAPIDRAFQQYSDRVEHLIIHTGQHYGSKMSDAFFQDLEMPTPARFLEVGSGTHAQQTAKIMVAFEQACLELQPDLVIVVGDVNSTIACALTAVKLGIKVAHVEAGLRSFDRTMPEEINRIATDAICDFCFVTEESGLINLKKENFPEEKIFFVGNTMIDSLHFAMPKAEKSEILAKLAIAPKEYILATLHRPSNVDSPENLEMLLRLLGKYSLERKIIFPIHPRTRKNISEFGLSELLIDYPGIILSEPLGYIDFLALMKNADFVVTDSGGIQEETTALGVPCITARMTTERPVTVTLGTNILVKPEEKEIDSAINAMIFGPRKKGKIPPLWDGRAAERIVDQILLNCLGAYEIAEK